MTAVRGKPSKGGASTEHHVIHIVWREKCLGKEDRSPCLPQETVELLASGGLVIARVEVQRQGSQEKRHLEIQCDM